VSDKDLYSILGVSRSAADTEIKKNYRALARQYHPDRNPSPQAEEKFKEISAAFAVLGDAKKRSLYDDFGPDGLRDGVDADGARNYQQWAGQSGGRGGFSGGGFGGFGDFEDILGGLFGGGMGGFSGPTQRRGRSVESTVTISLQDALQGRELELKRQGVTLKLPSGVVDGQKMRLAGKGEQGPGGAGDLILLLRVATPPGYDLAGADLTLEMPITVAQAIRGEKLDVLTPEGSRIKLTLPPGSQSGQRLRIRGKGMTLKGGRGNLFVRLMIHVPKTNDPDCLALAESLEAFYDQVETEPTDSP
jgi:DnaJ-class molecular chaperone